MDRRKCDKRADLCKKILAILAIAAAMAAILYKLKQWQDRRKEEIDAYLMDDPDDTFFVHTDNSNLVSDIEEWKNLSESDRISLSFLVDPAKAKDFQEAMAKEGCSSTYDDEFHILDVLVSGPMDGTELKELAQNIDQAYKTADAVYEGFAFD